MANGRSGPIKAGAKIVSLLAEHAAYSAQELQRTPHVLARPFLMSLASDRGRRRHRRRSLGNLAARSGPAKGMGRPTPTGLHVARRVLASERRRLRGDALSSDPRSNISIHATSR